MLETDVAVIGAGISGCVAALALQQSGLDVIVIEQSSLQQNKFCGEFISGEAQHWLKKLNMVGPIQDLNPTVVSRWELHGCGGAVHRMPLAAEGFGLSRRALDSAMAHRAQVLGARFLERCGVETISGSPSDGYRLGLGGKGCPDGIEIRSRAVIGAFGKSSTMNRLLRGKTAVGRKRLVGVKQHYRGAHRDGKVALYLFPGGYSGTVRIEGGLATLCMLATQEALQDAGGDPQALIQHASRANPALADWLAPAEPLESSLMTISGVHFGSRSAVVNGVFLAGDSGGLMPPFLGIGVVNGIRSALAAAEVVGRIAKGLEHPLEGQRAYQSWWNQYCNRSRLWGSAASNLLLRAQVGDLAIRCLNRFPALGERIYGYTRGFPETEPAGDVPRVETPVQIPHKPSA